MEKSYSESYAAAGVDITAGYEAVRLMKQYVARTMNEHCIGGLGGFGGLFELDCTDMPHPVLISGTDGVGTKLRIAQLMDRHDTIGIDCVAMCVNDIICAGAKPLVFLDYIACGKNVPERIAEIVKGVAEGCVQADCSLVGGETAEHPGVMPEDDYDLAGFTVGAVDKSKILDNSTMQAGDVIIALPSTGVHSNGFSLVRKIFDLENNPDILKKHFDELGCTLGEALLAPTKIYVKPVLALMKEITVKGVSHITGGGFYENIPRSLKDGCCARIAKADVRTPALFELLAKTGNISEHDMFNTFNMGVGMVLTVAAEDADKAIEILKANGQDAYRLGVIAEIVDGQGGVQLPGQVGDLGAQGVGALVPDHGVHVDDRLDVVALLQLPLDVVNQVVELQHVSVGRHLGVEGHHGPARAIVVIDQVVDAQNVVVGEHNPVDVRGKLRVHGASQQGVQGVLCGVPAGFQDKGGHQQARQAVHPQVPEVAGQGGEQHHPGGGGVGEGVGRGGLHGGRADGAPQAAVKPEHPQLYPDGGA